MKTSKRLFIEASFWGLFFWYMAALTNLVGS